MTEWKKPLPVEIEETKPYWDGCQREKLIIQRCRMCGKYQTHYRGFCAHCWTGEIEDVEASGRGTLWSYSAVYRNRSPGFSEEVPYVVAVVELEEGLKLPSNIINCDLKEVSVGMPVKLTFVRASERFNIPMFKPAQDN